MRQREGGGSVGAAVAAGGRLGGYLEGKGRGLDKDLTYCLRSTCVVKVCMGEKAVIRTRSVNPLKSRGRGSEVGVEAFEGESGFAA